MADRSRLHRETVAVILERSDLEVQRDETFGRDLPDLVLRDCAADQDAVSAIRRARRSGHARRVREQEEEVRLRNVPPQRHERVRRAEPVAAALLVRAVTWTIVR